MRPLSKMRLVLILIGLATSGQGRAVESGLLGPVVSEPKSSWVAAEPTSIKASASEEKAAERVRIGLHLTPFKKIITRQANGSSETRLMPGEPMRHTLRARLNETNHFFIGNWHVETVPLSLIRKTRHYQVRINVYERYGDYGQLEENLGSVTVSGVLEPQERGTSLLVGVGKQRLRDRFGNPYLDVVAGFKPQLTTQPRVTLSPASTTESSSKKAQKDAPSSSRL